MKLLLVGLIGAVIGVACTVAYYEWWESEPDEETAVKTAIQPTYPGHIALCPKHSAGLPDINSGQPGSESRHEPP